jgi:hypothetical protein
LCGNMSLASLFIEHITLFVSSLKWTGFTPLDWLPLCFRFRRPNDTPLTSVALLTYDLFLAICEKPDTGD